MPVTCADVTVWSSFISGERSADWPTVNRYGRRHGGAALPQRGVIAARRAGGHAGGLPGAGGRQQQHRRHGRGGAQARRRGDRRAEGGLRIGCACRGRGGDGAGRRRAGRRRVARSPRPPAIGRRTRPRCGHGNRTQASRARVCGGRGTPGSATRRCAGGCARATACSCTTSGRCGWPVVTHCWISA